MSVVAVGLLEYPENWQSTGAGWCIKKAVVT
jgi:hypothetical protein